MSRLIYPVGFMVACNIGGKVLLVEPDDFRDLVERLLVSWDELDIIAFKMAVFEATAILNARKRYTAWEREFISKFKRAVVSHEFNPCYKFEDIEAQRRIGEYLEAFSSSFRCIKVVTAPMHDRKDTLFNVTLRARQSIYDRLCRRYGRFLDEWNFLRSEVTLLTGSSFNFGVTISDSKYVFAPSGAVREF